MTDIKVLDLSIRTIGNREEYDAFKYGILDSYFIKDVALCAFTADQCNKILGIGMVL